MVAARSGERCFVRQVKKIVFQIVRHRKRHGNFVRHSNNETEFVEVVEWSTIIFMRHTNR
jgi:hypothetical protein